MILDKLAKFNKSQRIPAVVLMALAAAGICYFVITRSSVVKLQEARANYTEMRTICTEMESRQAELPNLQKQLQDAEKQLQERQSRCFSRNEAMQFFERINALAIIYSLKPLSRIISEPKEIESGKTNSEKTGPLRNFLKTQSVNIAVSGNYFDIVDFINDLTDCRQKVLLTNLRIALPAGEEFNPKASFEITIIIDSLKDVEK